MFFYYSVNMKGDSHVPYLTRFSIANTGSEFICGNLDYTKNSSIVLRCPREDTTIDSLKIIGVTKNDASTCRGAINAIKPERNFIR